MNNNLPHKILDLTQSKNHNHNHNYISTLPLEILNIIINFLPLQYKISVSSTCKFLREIITSLYIICKVPYFNFISNELTKMIMNYCDIENWKLVSKKFYILAKSSPNRTKYVGIANHGGSRLIEQYNNKGEICYECKKNKACVKIGKSRNNHFVIKLVCENCNVKNYSYQIYTSIKNKMFQTRNFTIVYSNETQNYFITTKIEKKVYKFDNYYVVTSKIFNINFIDHVETVVTDQGVYYCILDAKKYRILAIEKMV